MGPRSVTVLALAALLAAAVPAHGEDLLDYVIAAVDQTLAPARPLIECLANGGDAQACAAEAAKRQAAGALPVGPSDDRVIKAVKVFEAARAERWFEVLSVGGEVVARSVTCAMLPLSGPLKGSACGIIGWVVANKAKELGRVYEALTGPDWWALVEIAGTGVCEFIPGDGPAGAAKDILCGPLASVLVEAKKFAEVVSNGVVAGADALESAIFGDDSHMPYERYYALFWQPWYHYSVARVLKGQSLGMSDIYSDCVDYFDSHNQYRKTARKTCRNFESRYKSTVEAFARAMPVAVDGYFESVARPAVRGFVLASYGKPAAAEVPGRRLFELNCAFQMRIRFPFPEADDAACKMYEQRSASLKATPGTKTSAGLLGADFFATVYANLAKQCHANVTKQNPEPASWPSVCEEAGRSYAQAFAGESLKLIATVGKLKQQGCAAADPATAKEQGLLLTCSTPDGFWGCRAAFPTSGEKHCRGEVAVASTATRGRETSVGGGPVLGAVQAAGGGQPQTSAAGAGRASPAPAGRTAMAAAAVLRALPVEVEAEALVASGKFQLRGGQVVSQPMAGFGEGWGGGAQLFWHGGAAGATLDLLIDVPQPGSWSVEILLTRAPDYAQLQFEVDQHPVLARFDGYGPKVGAPVAVPLGTFALQAGLRRVSLMIVGRNSESTGWLAGVDRVRLVRAGGQ